jgi:hypothetical protein
MDITFTADGTIATIDSVLRADELEVVEVAAVG